MARITGIEYCDSSWTPWWGCTEVSDGCHKCWARDMTQGGAWGNNPRVRTTPKYWQQPLLWNADAPRFLREHGRRQRVFGGHLCDIFDNQAKDEWRVDFFKLIQQTPELIWQLFTKRPQNALKMLPPDWADGYANAWLGISAENQHFFDQRWEILSTLPALIRFVSYEPALGPVTLRHWSVVPDWIIVGGESGEYPRKMDPQWARDLRDECKARGIAFFMKQMRGKGPIPPDLMIRQFPRNPGTRR